MRRHLPLLCAAALLTLGACDSGLKITAPSGPGVCWYISQASSGEIRNTEVAKSIPNIEQCAAELERMRIRFLRMGGSNHEILGSYQGTFIFVTREGIFTSQRLKGMRYPLLMRVNGKLVVPGAVVEAPPQPVDSPPK